jgi:TPR repeat protein
MRLSITLLLLILTFSAGTSCHASDEVEKLVMEKMNAGDVQAAFQLANDAADKGDAWAMDLLGALYLSGAGPSPKNYALAAEWLRKAALKGNGDSMSRLGEMYFNGWGVERNIATATDWYRRGVTMASAAAMNNLGTCLLRGDGVARNIPEGLALIEKAAERDPVAKENLAAIKRRGEYGPPDPDEALRLYEASAEYGSSSAMVVLAQMFFNGEGKPKDLALSCRWAILAYTKGRVEAIAHVRNVCRPQLSKEEFAHASEDAKRWVDQHPGAFGVLSRP